MQARCMHNILFKSEKQLYVRATTAETIFEFNFVFEFNFLLGEIYLLLSVYSKLS